MLSGYFRMEVIMHCLSMPLIQYESESKSEQCYWIEMAIDSKNTSTRDHKPRVTMHLQYKEAST